MKKRDRFKRNQKLVKFAREHPEYSQEDLGEKFGKITGSAVSRILLDAKEAVK